MPTHKWRPRKAQDGLLFRAVSNWKYKDDGTGAMNIEDNGLTGTFAIPELIVKPKLNYYQATTNTPSAKKELEESRLNKLISHSELHPITGLPLVIGLKSVYPEFDIINGLQMINPIRGILDIAKRKVTFTGVLNRLKDDKFMLDTFFEKDFPIWSTDNYLAAKEYSIGPEGGNVFKIFGNTKRLADTPTPPNNSQTTWIRLPFDFNKKGKVEIVPRTRVRNSKEWEGKRINSNGESDYYNEFRSDLVNDNTTDQLFRGATERGYDGIIFHNVYDGGFYDPRVGTYVDTPINEWVYKAGADIIKAPLDVTKYDLMRNDVEKVVPRVINSILNMYGESKE